MKTKHVFMENMKTFMKTKCDFLLIMNSLMKTKYEFKDNFYKYII